MAARTDKKTLRIAALIDELRARGHVPTPNHTILQRLIRNPGGEPRAFVGSWDVTPLLAPKARSAAAFSRALGGATLGRGAAQRTFQHRVHL